MKSKHPRIAYRKLLGLLLIILASCKFQSPEISNNSENADIVSLQSIGFSKSDNSWLTQDCITQVDNSKDDIYIILPYAVNAADLQEGVIITFTAKSTQTRVGMPDSQTATQISGDPWISGQTKLIFASPGATQPVRLLMNHPISGDLIVRDYIVHTKKNIRPKLLNSEITERSGTETAITLKFQIVDENDNPIPALSQSTGTWLDEESLPIWYTESKITLLNYPPQYDPAENAFLLEIEPRIQGISEIFFPNRVFEDQDGNVTTDTSTHPQDESIEGTLIRVKYSPSALYLSHAGNDENTGLTPEEPVRTLKRAKEIAAEEGIENINVAASNEPYDVAGEGEIRYSGPGTPWFSITGGWQEHFSQQYDTTEQSGDPKTTFIDSQQVTDLTGSDPVTAVLSYKSTVEPPFTPVLTDVTIKVDSTSPSINNSAALFVDGSSGTGAVKIILNNVDCQAFEGTGTDSNGMMVRKASVELRNSRITGGDVDSTSRAMLLSEISQVSIEDSEITGGNGGSGNSYGIEIVDSQDGTVTIDNSMIASGVVDNGKTYGIKAGELGTLTIINETRIIGGQANNGGTSCGIEALEGGILNFEYSSIVAGFENWGVDPGANESTVYGLHIKNTQANLRHVWIHSAPCADISVPVIYDADAGVSSSYLIATGNSFISGDANTAAGIIFNNDTGSTGTPWVFLQNSVLNVGQSGQGPAAGLHFKNSMTGYILNNVIHVKGSASNDSAGIKFSSSTYIADTGLNISNNLIYSDDVANLYGIISNFDITKNSFQNGAFQIHHNNFWDTDNTAPSQASFYINSDKPLDELQRDALISARSGKTPRLLGNISQAVTVDMDYDYLGNDFMIGELSGPGIDVALGGVDLIASGIGIENFPGAVSMEIDTSGKGGTTRTGQSKLGWTMGAYEYDINALPTEIYVATDGSDGHPLGTETAPFASLARAYTAARVDSLYQPRWEVSDIRVKAGEYESTEPIIITNTGKGLTITGVDENTVKATLKNEKTETVIVFQGQSQSSGNPPSSSNPTVFRNFAVTSSLPSTAASGIGIHIRDGSDVHIKNCIINVNGPLTTYGIKVNSDSHPTIENNEINLNLNANSYGIILEDSSTLPITSNPNTNSITANIDIQTN